MYMWPPHLPSLRGALGEHRPPGPAPIIMPAPKLSQGKRGCMVFRDHARVGLLWLVVTCPPLALRSVPLRARLALPSVSFSSSARRPCVVPVAASLCSRSSARARPPPPLAAFCVPVPRSCALRSARARAGARPVLHCAPHSVRAVSPPPLACASTHAASGARPAPAAPRATPSSPVAAPRTSPAALLFCSRPAQHADDLRLRRSYLRALVY